MPPACRAKALRVAENIGFGVESHDKSGYLPPRQGSYSDERVQEVMQIAQLSKDVEDFPDGISTMIGERGVTLSDGQK